MNMLARQQMEQFHFTLNYIHQLFSHRPNIPNPNVPKRLQQTLVFLMPQRPTPDSPALERRPTEDNFPYEFDPRFLN